MGAEFLELVKRSRAAKQQHDCHAEAEKFEDVWVIQERK
jgi:hypothetical protein